MKTVAILTALTCLASCAFVPTPAAADAASTDAELTIGTGPMQSVYSVVGNAVCRILVEQSKHHSSGVGARCGTATSTGSLANLQALRTRSEDLAFLQSDVAQQAVKGTGSFKGRPVEELRLLFSLHTEPFQLLVPRDLGLKSFEELKGKKINVGKPDTAPNEMFLTLMKIHGLTDASFSNVLHTPAAEQFSAFCDNDIEALGMMTGYPNASYARAIADCNGSLLSLDTPVDRRMIQDTPYYRPVVIPKDAYASLDHDVPTFGVVTVVAVRADMPDEAAYRIVRDVFERIDDLRAMHPALAGLDAAHMATDGITAPLHPGALRYFKERGLLGGSRSSR